MEINRYLKKRKYSDKYIYNLIKNRCILIDDKIVLSKHDKVKLLSKVTINDLDEKCELGFNKKDIDIIYEDKYFLIVNKPYDLCVEPTINDFTNNLASMVHYYYKVNNIKSNIHIVNRLDKLTQGIVVFAKTSYIHNLMATTKIKKKYEALVYGQINRKKTIKIKIDRKEGDVKRFVSDSGKLSITKIKPLKCVDNNTFIDIRLLTGRTHQIRLSLAHINHPLLNDPLYSNNINGDMYLKCYHISFNHPITKKKISISI